MPKLNEFVSVGFCSGYGDGDYRISMAIQSFDRKKLNELLLAMHHASCQVESIWRRGQKQIDQNKAAAKETSNETEKANA